MRDHDHARRTHRNAAWRQVPPGEDHRTRRHGRHLSRATRADGSTGGGEILNRDQAENRDSVRRFLREARMVAEIKHPNVVDMGEDADHQAYVVLELLEGEALSDLLTREGPLSFARASELLTPVMRALAYAHALGVVHRDVKPENIFIHRDHADNVIPKVLDFGLARALRECPEARITQTGLVMGTPMYMSPEQCDGISERIGPAADVWAWA